MFERRSLKAPITLGVAMIVLIVVLFITWIVGNVIAAGRDAPPIFFWSMLAVGSVILACVLGGVIAYLTMSVQTINLNRRQSNFIDSVTHELKSPIASLKLYLQTLSLRDVDAEQRYEFHRSMLEDVERLDQLISHLLDTGRVEKGNLLGEDEAFNLSKLLREISASVCNSHQLPVESVTLNTPETWILSKPVQLEILFRNLIDNAVKYGGTPPEVWVDLQPQPNQRILVTVSDAGPGIPAHQRRKVFGRFVRLGNELERSRPGTGLGLYLVRTIVRSLGGNIRVRDRRNGTGARLEVLLPGHIDLPVDATGTAMPPRSSAASNQKPAVDPVPSRS